MQASERSSGRLVVNELPGLKSVASATAAPASTSARAGASADRGRGRLQEAARRPRRYSRAPPPPAPVASRWSMLRAPSSIASGTAPLSVNWSPWRRSASPAPRQASRNRRAWARVERPALQEDVGRDGETRRLGKHVGEDVVEVRVRIAMLRRDGVCAEPRRRAAGSANRLQRRELRVAVEPVAGLAFPRRRARARASTRHAARRARAAPSGAERPRRRDGREDAAARRVQLLVARAAGAERELVDAVAAERRMRVAVDEPGNRAEPGAVELLDLAVDRLEVAHPPDRGDRLAAAEDVRVLDHVDRAQVGAARGPRVPGAGVATWARSRRSRAPTVSSTRRTSASKGRARAPRPPLPGSPRRDAARRPSRGRS